jgi:hypothetical protein
MDGRVIHPGIPTTTLDIHLTLPGTILTMGGDMVTIMDSMTGIIMEIITVIMMATIPIIARYITDHAVLLKQIVLPLQEVLLR